MRAIGARRRQVGLVYLRTAAADRRARHRRRRGAGHRRRLRARALLRLDVLGDRRRVRRRPARGAREPRPRPAGARARSAPGDPARREDGPPARARVDRIRGRRPERERERAPWSDVPAAHDADRAAEPRASSPAQHRDGRDRRARRRQPPRGARDGGGGDRELALVVGQPSRGSAPLDDGPRAVRREGAPHDRDDARRRPGATGPDQRRRPLGQRGVPVGGAARHRSCATGSPTGGGSAQPRSGDASASP